MYRLWKLRYKRSSVALLKLKLTLYFSAVRCYNWRRSWVTPRRKLVKLKGTKKTSNVDCRQKCLISRTDLSRATRLIVPCKTTSISWKHPTLTCLELGPALVAARRLWQPTSIISRAPFPVEPRLCLKTDLLAQSHEYSLIQGVWYVPRATA